MRIALDSVSPRVIGLALFLHGMHGLSLGETRQRICTWRVGFETQRWTTLPRWVAAVAEGRLGARVRPSAAGASLRQKAERAAATLCGLALTAHRPEAQVFEGAALAA